MKTHLLRSLRAAALLGGGFILGGCASLPDPTPDAPVATARYLINTLETRVTAEIEPLLDAFDTVMEERGFTRTKFEISDDGEDAEATYRGPGDLGVYLEFEREARSTEVEIQYGLTGSEYESREILEAVVERL
jgi:hypothetical protein